MNRSKFTFVQQKRSILKNIPKPKNNEVKKAGIGEDYGRLMLLSEKSDGASSVASSEIAVTEGLCLKNALGYVRSDVIKLYNKLKVGGYEPIAISDTLIMDKPDEKEMKKILRELCNAANELRVDIMYGHTEICSDLSAPAVTVTMYGKGKGVFSPARVKPGMEIVMCGQTGILGTLLKATEKKEDLLTRYSEEYLRTAEKFKELLVLENQAEIAKKYGAVYSHHISTGGVFAALWEVACGCGLGFTVCHDNIPIMQETVEICEFTGDNPYMIDGCGAILFVTEEGEALSDALYLAGYEASVIGVLTAGNDRIITHDGEVRYLSPPRYINFSSP